jgi:MATE family multidrug resistance protein
MHPRLLQENQKDYQSIHYVDRDRSSTLELEALLGFTFPLLITFLMAYGIRIMDVWFLGKLGSEGKVQ